MKDLLTLSEIVKVCVAESECHRRMLSAAPDYYKEHLRVTTDLIKALALHVKQMKIHVCGLEDVIYHGKSTVSLTIKPRTD